MAKKDHKLSYKLYQPDGTYIKTLDGENILSEFQVNKSINGGVGNLKVVLNKPIDDYDEYDSVKNPNGSIKYGNRLKVFLNDADNTDKQIFYGYLVSIGPQYANGKESVELNFYGAVSKLSNDYYNTSGSPPYEPTEPAGFYVTDTAVPASTIIKNIVDNFILQTTNPMVSYIGGSIVDCGNSVTYTFDRMKHLDSLRKIVEYLPATWYWFIDGAGVIYVRDSSSATEHTLTIGKNIYSIKAHKSMQSIVNYFILWNGRSTADAAYVYRDKKDATSQSDYDRTTLFQQDSEVLTDAVADVRKDRVIAYRKDPKQGLTIEVNDAYDIASIEPGHRVNIRNIKDDTQTTFADGLVIKRISYTADSALLELAQIGENFTKAMSEEETLINNSIKQAQTFSENLQAGSTPITQANIMYGGGNFINSDIINAYTSIGSCIIGVNSSDAVLKSYGKTGFNDASVGFWLQKDASNYSKFELYYDTDNYLRFNSQTGLLEIAGDIVMSPGSTIVWAQISDANVPNSADLSNFNNDSGWTTDDNLDLLRAGALSGGTFISNNIVYSPVIAGNAGYFKNSITVGASGIGAVIKSYGKNTYADGNVGYYLERTSGGRVYFELYQDATHYLRFDSSGATTIEIRGKLNADDITAGTLSANYINGGDINGVTITGVTITGGTFQTLAAANRGIKINTSDFRAYDSSGNLRLLLSGTTGFLTVYSNSAVAGGSGYSLVYSGTERAKINAWGMVVRRGSAFSAASNLSGDLGNDWFRFLCDWDGTKGKYAGHIQGPNTDLIRITDYLGNTFVRFYSQATWFARSVYTEVNVTYNLGSNSRHWFALYCQNISYAGQLRLWMTTSLILYESGWSVWSWYINGSDSYMGAGQLDAKIASSRNFTLQSLNIWLVGTVWKSAGSFTIDHPLKPKTHFLCHSFVESPEMLNIYRGNVMLKKGRAKVTMPDWFVALNGDNPDDFSYQLTSIGGKNDLWVEDEMKKGELVIAGENDLKVGFIITAVRHDPYAEENRIQVEVEKKSVGKEGQYMYPQHYTPKNKKVVVDNKEIWMDEDLELEKPQTILAKANIIK